MKKYKKRKQHDGIGLPKCLHRVLVKIDDDGIFRCDKCLKHFDYTRNNRTHPERDPWK